MHLKATITSMTIGELKTRLQELEEANLLTDNDQIVIGVVNTTQGGDCGPDNCYAYDL